jgi:hypothetical protein
MVPWYKAAVNLIGPWTLLVHGQEIEFYVLTCINPVSSLVEITQIKNKSAAYVGMIFENTWLAQYPKPDQCVHDNGGEFIGANFISILTINGVKDVLTTVKTHVLMQSVKGCTKLLAM